MSRRDYLTKSDISELIKMAGELKTYLHGINQGNLVMCEENADILSGIELRMIDIESDLKDISVDIEGLPTGDEGFKPWD